MIRRDNTVLKSICQYFSIEGLACQTTTRIDVQQSIAVTDDNVRAGQINATKRHWKLEIKNANCTRSMHRQTMSVVHEESSTSLSADVDSQSAVFQFIGPKS